MPINSRNKGATFERQIANALMQDLNLRNPVKRILEQTRTKELPDLTLGNWCIECKALTRYVIKLNNEKKRYTS